MSLVEASLASAAVKFAPWAPSWEEGIEVGSGGHVAPVVSQRRDFTETERELLHRGVELIIGVKESQELEQPDPSDVALSPSSPHSTAHYVVRRVPGPVYQVETFLIPVEQVMLHERKMPDEFISADGCDVTDAFVEWCRPLIGSPLRQFITFKPTL